MRPRENYAPHIGMALVLTLAILVSFQVYILREPARIAADESRDTLIAVAAGRSLFAANCAMCHGEAGEGVDAPPLNDSRLLNEVSNERLFSLISSGVPGSEMPAWNQVHGGPFTDEEVRQLVAFIRDWQPNAPDRQALEMVGDPAQGLVIFYSTCIVCHGEGGQGTDRAPALNDPVKLAQLDDDWYADTITQGRPAQGMPTWGTVLSPAEVRDLVALLRAWGRGETVESPGAGDALAEALHLLERNDLRAAEQALEGLAESATGEVLAAINRALEALEAGDRGAAEAAIQEASELLGMQGGGQGMESDGRDMESGG